MTYRSSAAIVSSRPRRIYSPTASSPPAPTMNRPEWPSIVPESAPYRPAVRHESPHRVRGRWRSSVRIYGRWSDSIALFIGPTAAPRVSVRIIYPSTTRRVSFAAPFRNLLPVPPACFIAAGYTRSRGAAVQYVSEGLCAPRRGCKDGGRW